MSRPLFQIAVTLMLASLVGCATNERISVSELGDRAALEAKAPEFWAAEDVPRSGKATPKVAIAEFVIEYLQHPDVDVSTSIRLELPSILYRVFAETIREFDGVPIEMNSVSGTAAYTRLKGVTHAEAGFAAAKAGTSQNASVWYPVQGLLCVDDLSDTDAIMADLRKETGADTVLRVRLKVATDDGHGVIRKGSTFRVYSQGRKGGLESQLDLISDGLVIDELAREQSGILAVDSNALIEQSRELFRKYISMALVAIGDDR